MKSSWYPFSSCVDLNLKADRLFGRSDLALCRELGRDTGHSTVIFPGPGRASYQVHELAAPRATLCRSLEGFLHGSLEVMALRDVEVRHVHCRLDGAAVCEYEGTWTPR